MSAPVLTWRGLNYVSRSNLALACQACCAGTGPPPLPSPQPPLEQQLQMQQPPQPLPPEPPPQPEMEPSLCARWRAAMLEEEPGLAVRHMPLALLPPLVAGGAAA